MAVYIINNMTIHDRAAYDEYVRAFWPIFLQYGGKLLVASDHPAPLEGAWPFDRTVILEFPDRAEAQRWYESPEYREIAQHRFRGTTSNVVILDGLPPLR